jgi:hypothetical protein
MHEALESHTPWTSCPRARRPTFAWGRPPRI